MSVRRQRRFLCRIAALCASCTFLNGYIIGLIGMALPAATHSLSLSAVWAGAIGSAALCGILIGSPVAGWACERFGRRPVLITQLVVFVAASLAQLAVTGPTLLLALRLLLGIAMGSDYVVSSLLFAEFAPPRHRGRFLTGFQLSWYIGFLTACVIGAITLGTEGPWRTVLASSALPAVIISILSIGVPESPRWLAAQGRTGQARTIAQRYIPDADEISSIAPIEQSQSQYRELFSSRYRTRTAFICLFWLCNVLPYYAMATYTPTLLNAFHIADGLAAALASNAAAVAGALVCVLVVERQGRRGTLLCSFWGAAAALLLVATWPTAPATVIIASFLTFSFFNAGGGSLVGPYPSEVLPTSIRATGIGLASAISRIGAIIGTFLLPIALNAFGAAPVLLTGTLVLAVGACATHRWAPETSGQRLPEHHTAPGRTPANSPTPGSPHPG
uniref:Sugar porter family MFS transporter n=1 Tax=Streptomyces sp. NBC_00003 TaxID=2903608 RepID=A0AAU2VD35_9ACTN